MATIEALMRNLKAVDFNEVMEDAVTETTPQLIDKQRDQMLRGKNSLGELIGKYKSDPYAKKKFNLNPLAGFGNVDLRLSHDFHKDIFVDPRDKGFVIDSGNEKTENLIEKYGKEIFGLNKENAGEYAVNTMGPAATKKIIQQIHK